MEHTATGDASASARSKQKSALRTSAADDSPSSTRIAYTLTACCRCRQRKTRCDPRLPRCEPCERTNSVCEYWDPTKGRNINRNYVVWLQHRVQALEEELERTENDDGQEDPEAMVRNTAAVKLAGDTDETRFLGPSSGTTITRLVMQLAKQFTDAKTIKEIVPEHRARQVKELYAAEAQKPTSKVYPLISDVAASELPNRSLTDMLVQLYNLKVQTMYPALHEPTFAKDVDIVYAGEGNAYQNFILRMVIAVSLQKMDTQFAGLADSFYLAALQYLEPVVKPMDLQTLQAFALIAEYSLLTPTRTAIYYIIGLAVRLTQALGINEEKTITRGRGGAKANCLEIDMRRRMFWCIWVMEGGLSHSLGRPHSLATGREHIDVGFFETVADEHITPEGIVPGAPQPTLKKWIAIHFFKMRLLQHEIRKTLYLKKRPTPKDDQDPWFHQMLAKCEAWRDASPNNDGGTGLTKVWFIGRFNTMVVFMFRPSPQIPRPSADAADKCFEACKYNIHMTRAQLAQGNVDLTWIFTQAIFMAINAMLWSLSFSEVRKKNPKQEVQKHLHTAIESISICAERWPGVSSAITLYHDLIDAILKAYDKDGDIPLPGDTPSDATSPQSSMHEAFNQSRTTSPAAVSSSSIATPPDKPLPPFGYFHHAGRRSVEQPPPVPYQSEATSSPGISPSVHPSPSSSIRSSVRQVSAEPQPNGSGNAMNFASYHHNQSISYDPLSHFNPLPTTMPDTTLHGWNPAYLPPQAAQHPGVFGRHTAATNHTSPLAVLPATSSALPSTSGMPLMYDFAYNSTMPAGPLNPPTADFMYNQQYWDAEPQQYGSGPGLTEEQQLELMQSLETSGMEDIQTMINHTVALFGAPNGQSGQHGG